MKKTFTFCWAISLCLLIAATTTTHRANAQTPPPVTQICGTTLLTTGASVTLFSNVSTNFNMQNNAVSFYPLNGGANANSHLLNPTTYCITTAAGQPPIWFTVINGLAEIPATLPSYMTVTRTVNANGTSTTCVTGVAQFITTLGNFGTIGGGMYLQVTTITFNANGTVNSSCVIPAAPNNLLSQLVSYAALPVNLVSFDAKTDCRTTTMQWQVSDEINMDYYQVQQSTNGEVWQTQARVASGQTHYTSTVPHQGNRYCRLVGIDVSGKVDFVSPIRQLDADCIAKQVRVYPNPATDQIIVQTDRNTTISIVDILGKTLQTIEIQKGNTTIPITNLSNGTYWIQNEGKAQKFVVIK